MKAKPGDRSLELSNLLLLYSHSLIQSYSSHTGLLMFVKCQAQSCLWGLGLALLFPSLHMALLPHFILASDQMSPPQRGLPAI